LVNIIYNEYFWIKNNNCIKVRPNDLLKPPSLICWLIYFLAYFFTIIFMNLLKKTKFCMIWPEFKNLFTVFTVHITINILYTLKENYALHNIVKNSMRLKKDPSSTKHYWQQINSMIDSCIQHQKNNYHYNIY